MIIVYLLKNTINEKKYVGQTSKTLEQRMRCGCGYYTCEHIYNAIRCYGVDKFYYEVLEVCDSREEADELEKYYIKKYDTCNQENGYNIVTGGRAPMKGKRHTPETIDKMKQAHIGKNTWMKGRTNHHSEEHKKELSNKMKESEIWKLAPNNTDHLKKWVKEVHTKIHKEEYPIIIAKYSNGTKSLELAKEYNVHITVIQEIVKGKAEKHTSAKIPKEKYEYLIVSYNNGIKATQLANEFNVSVSCIRRTIKRIKNASKQ